MGQGQNKGPDSFLGDGPARYFSENLSPEKQNEFMFKLQDLLEEFVKKLSKPTGEKHSPAKTCGDLFATYSDKRSGKISITRIHFISLIIITLVHKIFLMCSWNKIYDFQSSFLC